MVFSHGLVPFRFACQYDAILLAMRLLALIVFMVVAKVT